MCEDKDSGGPASPLFPPKNQLTPKIGNTITCHVVALTYAQLFQKLSCCETQHMFGKWIADFSQSCEEFLLHLTAEAVYSVFMSQLLLNFY